MTSDNIDRLRTLACDPLKSLTIGGLLAFGGVFASGPLMAWSMGVGEESFRGAAMLVFMACMTPMTIYADYRRSVPALSLTLCGWLCISTWFLLGGMAAWLNFKAAVFAMDPQNRGWDRAVMFVAFALAFFVSRRVQNRVARNGGRAHQA